MTWEEIIVQIRKDPSYQFLVEKAYFEEELPLNVERFRKSEEFRETLREIRSLFAKTDGIKLLDLGAGNGVATLAFALEGFEVTAVEPDNSETIGSGAIAKLEEHYKTGRVKVIESFGENLPLDDHSFGIVYVRQAMHHASELNSFIRQAVRVLKKNGLLFTVRDHVIYDNNDKQWFLESHPLHRFYGGENAFTFEEYRNAIVGAGMKIIRFYRHYESVINYFPETTEEVGQKRKEREKMIDDGLGKKLPSFLVRNKWIRKRYAERLDGKLGPVLDERKIPGRLISFISVKN